MKSCSVAAIKIVYGAVFPDFEFPGLTLALDHISSVRKDYIELIAYAAAISDNKVGDYYGTLTKQLANVIAERDAVRAIRDAGTQPQYIQVLGRQMRVKMK